MMASQSRACVNCGGSIFRYNRSGYCRNTDCLSVRMRLHLASNPDLKEAHVANLRRIARDPHIKEQKRRRWIEGRYWEGTNEQRPAGTESRRRSAARISDTRLAAIPPHMRDRYRAMTRKGIRAPEARALILEEHEIEMRRWRKSVGAEPIVAPVIAPARSLPFVERAAIVAAAWACVPNLWAPTHDRRVARARWAVYLALRRGGWTPNRIGNETSMERKGVVYGLAKAEILAAVPGEFADLLRSVVAA